MEYPHEKWGVVLCPELCSHYKDFWASKQTGVCDKRVACDIWHPELSPCRMEPALDMPLIITQENFSFDVPPAFDARELKKKIETWLRNFDVIPIYEIFDPKRQEYRWLPERGEERVDQHTTVDVVLTDVSAQIYIKRICPIFFILKQCKKFGIEPSIREFFLAIWAADPLRTPELQKWREEWLSKATVYDLVFTILLHCRTIPVGRLTVEQVDWFWKSGLSMAEIISILEAGTVEEVTGLPNAKIPVWTDLTQVFKGVLNLEEMDVLYGEFLRFMEREFPDWRHET